MRCCAGFEIFLPPVEPPQWRRKGHGCFSASSAERRGRGSSFGAWSEPLTVSGCSLAASNFEGAVSGSSLAPRKIGIQRERFERMGCSFNPAVSGFCLRRRSFDGGVSGSSLRASSGGRRRCSSTAARATSAVVSLGSPKLGSTGKYRTNRLSRVRDSARDRRRSEDGCAQGDQADHSNTSGHVEPSRLNDERIALQLTRPRCQGA